MLKCKRFKDVVSGQMSHNFDVIFEFKKLMCISNYPASHSGIEQIFIWNFSKSKHQSQEIQDFSFIFSKVSAIAHPIYIHYIAHEFERVDSSAYFAKQQMLQTLLLS